MNKTAKVAVCEGKNHIMYDMLGELGYGCVRVGADAASITSAILNSEFSAFAADNGAVETDVLHKVFGFLRSINLNTVCIVINSDPDEYSEYGFVHCCRKGHEFESIVYSSIGRPTNTKRSFGNYESICARKTAEEGGLESTVTEIIQKMGVPANVKGYRYLRNAVMVATEDMTVLDSVTKRLYPIVAMNNHTTPTRVERAIRHAITTAWDRQNGDKEFIEDKLRCRICFDGDKPTNSELIALISDCLRINAR